MARAPFRLTVMLVDMFADRMDQVVMSVHSSHDVGPADRPELVCVAHRPPEPWPCDDWFRAVERIAARRHGPHEKEAET